MADTIEMQDIRGLDIDKTVKGFALVSYIFKNDCTISDMSGDSVRWYQETAADPDTTTDAAIGNISRLSEFINLEHSWTRNTSYPRKYGAKVKISMEDIKSADIDVLARQLLRLTRAVAREVDERIYSVMTDGYPTAQAVSTSINSVATTAPWDTAAFAGVNIVEDIMDAKQQIWEDNYDPEGASLYLSPKDYKNVVTYLITSGQQIPAFASDKITTGRVLQLLGLNVKVSNNVTASGAAIVIPQAACTWKTFNAITSRVIEDPGIGTEIRVWESGEALLTDPKAVCLIYNTQTHS